MSASTRGSVVANGSRRDNGTPVEAHVHPVDAQVCSGVFGGCDDTSAQTRARSRRWGDRLRATYTLDGREASHESRAFHSLLQALAR